MSQSMTDPRERAQAASEDADDGGIDLGAPAANAPATGRLRSARARAYGTRDEATRRVDDLRERIALVDAALEAGELDRRRAGSLLAGGIAFRLFLWLLPAALFAAAVLALVRPSGAAPADDVAQQLGFLPSVAGTIEHATQHSDRGAAALITIGIALMLSTSMSLIRALRIAHVLAWEEPVRRHPRLLRDAAIVSAVLLAAITIETGVTYLRHQDAALLLLLVPMSFAIFGGAWLGFSLLLPHANANWRALLPGAALVAIGHAAMQVATVLYFQPKLAKAPVLYGALGSAATLLLWLFLFARLFVAAAFLNATLWRRSSGA